MHCVCEAEISLLIALDAVLLHHEIQPEAQLLSLFKTGVLLEVRRCFTQLVYRVARGKWIVHGSTGHCVSGCRFPQHFRLEIAKGIDLRSCHAGFDVLGGSVLPIGHRISRLAS